MVKYVAQFEDWDEAIEFSHQVIEFSHQVIRMTRADLKVQIAAIVFDSNLWESDRRPSEALCHALAGEIIDQLW